MGNHSVASISLTGGENVGFIMPALPWLLLQCRDGEKASRKVVSSCHLSLEAMYDAELCLEVWGSPSVACV